MSWQCPYCETVNQDAVPVCTVCDRIAPVIESFLSLEQIDNAMLYNGKLEEIHRYEDNGEFEKMLSSALEAIRLYKENGIAISKVKAATKHMLEKELVCTLIKLIEESMENHDLSTASNIVKIWEILLPKDIQIMSYKTKISESEENKRKMAELGCNTIPRKFPHPKKVIHEVSLENPVTGSTIEKSGSRKFPKVKRK